MKSLIAAVAMAMAVMAFAASLQAAGWTIDPGTVPKERNYSIPVQQGTCYCIDSHNYYRGCKPVSECQKMSGRCEGMCPS